MEKFKPLADVLQPDERNLVFVRLDTLEGPTLAEHHAEIAPVILNPSVPEDVRSYFAMIGSKKTPPKVPTNATCIVSTLAG